MNLCFVESDNLNGSSRVPSKIKRFGLFEHRGPPLRINSNYSRMAALWSHHHCLRGCGHNAFRQGLSHYSSTIWADISLCRAICSCALIYLQTRSKTKTLRFPPLRLGIVMPLDFNDIGASNIQPDDSKPAGNKASLWIALLISLFTHIFLLLMSRHFVIAPVTIRLENREFHVALQPNNESPAKPITESNIPKDSIAKPDKSVAPNNRNNVAAPARSASQKPPVERNTASQRLSDTPARVSILESAEAIIAAEAAAFNASRASGNSNLSDGDGGNNFGAALARDLHSTRAKNHNRRAESEALNTSDPTDSRERVAMNGKCFRLENIGGRGDQRAWYRINCIGKESTSDTMHRALLDHLKRK
jgi:hypothetical protein